MTPGSGAIQPRWPSPRGVGGHEWRNGSVGKAVAPALLRKDLGLHHPCGHPQYARPTRNPAQQTPKSPQINERAFGSCLTDACVEGSGVEVAAQATSGTSIKAAIRALTRSFFMAELSFRGAGAKRVLGCVPQSCSAPSSAFCTGGYLPRVRKFCHRAAWEQSSSRLCPWRNYRRGGSARPDDYPGEESLGCFCSSLLPP